MTSWTSAAAAAARATICYVFYRPLPVEQTVQGAAGKFAHLGYLINACYFGVLDCPKTRPSGPTHFQCLPPRRISKPCRWACFISFFTSFSIAVSCRINTS